MIKTILFDLGNVILFYDHRRSVRKLADLAGRPEEEIQSFIFSRGWKPRFDRGEIFQGEFYRRIKRQFKINLDLPRFRNLWSDIFWLNKPIVPLMHQLKSRYSLCLLSNTDPIHFNFILKKFPVMKLLTRNFVSYKLHCAKPDKKIYRIVLRRLNRPPNEVVYIDDAPEFISAACAVGIKNSILYKNITQLQKELARRNVI